MAQKVVFDGRLYVEPVSKATVVGGVNNAAAAASFSNICIIDDGIGATYGFGKGARTAASAGRQLDDFMYEFNDPNAMRMAIKGGVIWDLVEYLYNPANGEPGASKIFYCRAADTAPGVLSLTMADSSVWAFETVDEGLIANGTVTSSTLRKGYAITISAGVVDTAKFIVKFWLGTYKGVDADGLLFDGQTSTQAGLAPQLIVQSDEITTVAEFLAWANSSFQFQQWFNLGATFSTSGTLATADLTTHAGYQAFASGSETYSSAALDHVLSKITELDNTLFLAMKNANDAAGTNNVKIVGFIANSAEFGKRVFIGGGNGPTTFTGSNSSVVAAQTLNTEVAVVVHDGFTIPYSLNSSVMVNKSSLYSAALVVGRKAGMLPQTPLTQKTIRVGKPNTQLDKGQRELALGAGVLHFKKDNQKGWIINQGVNTLQVNDYMINNNGTSPEESIVAIKQQLNREIQEGAKQFLGGNLFNASQSVMEKFLTKTLYDRKAIPGTRDGLIVWFANAKAVRTGTTWNLTYDFQANSPINKVFSTGTIIDGAV